MTTSLEPLIFRAAESPIVADGTWKAIRYVPILTASALLWIAVVDLPPLPALADRDHSWALAYGHFLKHDFQAGVDYHFSYGPLGYFATRIYDPDLYWLKFGWEIVIKTIFTLTIIRLIQPIRNLYCRTVVLLVLAVVAHQIATMPDVICLFLILDHCSLLLRGHFHVPAARIGFSTFLIAVLALTKFTVLVYAAFGIGVVAMHCAIKGSPKRGLATAGAFAGSFVLIWLALGQSLLNFPSYLHGSLEIASGYTEAMAVPGSSTEIVLAAVAAVCLLLLIGLPLHRHVNANQAAQLLLIFVALFFMWKNGFIRHDHHSFGFFAFLLLVTLLFPTMFAGFRWNVIPRIAMLALVIFLSMYGMQSALATVHPNHTFNPLGIVSNAVRRGEETVQAVFHPDEMRARLEESRKHLTHIYDLPRIRSIVGERLVDILSDQQTVVLANGMNWRPRPVFQSYSAYTPFLIGANAEFFEGPMAPDFVIVKLGPIDHRLSAEEDSTALFALWRRYRPTLIEKGYLLLKKSDDLGAASTADNAHADTRTITLNEMVSLADDDEPKKLRLRPRLTKRGRVAKTAFKLPPLYLNVVTKDGRLKSFRFVPALGEAGFLLNPLLETNHDFILLYGSAPGQQVEKFWLTLRPEDAGYYQNHLEMTLESVPSLAGPTMSVAELNPIVYPGFTAFPGEVHSTAFVAIEQYGTADVVIVHADGVMKIPVSGEARYIEGRFGIMPLAYNSGDTDGVLFAVDYCTDDGTYQTLYERYLNPRSEPADKGIHDFRAALPSDGKGFVRLRTTCPPGTSSSWDWSYWSGIRLGPRRD